MNSANIFWSPFKSVSDFYILVTHVLVRRLAKESDLAKTRVKLEEALERVKSVQQAVTVDLPRITEVSFLCLSLTPWSFIGCLNMLASCFVGSRGDVEPQILLPPDGACSGGHDVAAGHRA